MFCDRCDKGFHSYCLGLRSIPEGDWCCPLCVKMRRSGPMSRAPIAIAPAPSMQPRFPSSPYASHPMGAPAPSNSGSSMLAPGEGFVCDFIVPETGRPCGEVLATKWMLRKHKDRTLHKKLPFGHSKRKADDDDF